MRLCITGSFGNQDIGDDAMLTMHLRHLEKIGVERKDITLVGRQPAYIAGYHEHPRAQCWPILPPVKDLDALLVTGGGTINTRDDDGASLKRMHEFVMPFAHAGKPIFMSGQTIGPLGTNSAHDKLAREIIEAVDVLTVRDVGLSRAFIDKIGAKPKVLIETTDDAINLPAEGDLPEELEEWVARGPCCAFNTTTYLTETPHQITRLAQITEDVGMRVLLVPMHPLDAFDLGKVRAQSNAEFLFVLTEEWRAGQVKKLLGKCTVAIGGRYHFLVFAGSLGLPFVGLSANEYSTLKQAGLVSALGLGRRTIFNMDWQGTGPSEAVAFANVERNHPKTQRCKSFDVVTEWMKAI